MMAGMTMLLVTDRRSGCILSSNQGQRITHQHKLVLRRTYAELGKSQNKRSSAKRRTVEPGTRPAPETVTSEHELVYSSYSGVR